MVIGALLVLCVSKFYGNVVVIIIYIIIFHFILIKTPYKGDNKNIRPLTNCFIVVAI